jgi:hypothetical protein
MNLFKKISTAISRIKPVLAIAAFSCIAPASSQAGTAVSGHVSGSSFAVSFSYFHDNLSPYGRWIDYEPYGWCWTPYNAYAGWRPYTHGYWAYTDYGWSWVSSEPFGWATYHYGRWVFDPYQGWVWVPDTVWAPSWVAWHEGPGWVGWAPLPPAAHWNVSVGFSFYDYDHIPSNSWCFVEDRHFGNSGIYTHVVSVSKNKWLLDRTHNVTRYRNHDGWPVNDGLDVRVIEKRGGKVKHLNVVNASSPFKSGDRIRGNAVEYYRPRIQEKNVRGLRPADRFVADRNGDRVHKSKVAERGGREVAFNDERASLEKNRENRRVEKTVNRVNPRQDAERVNKRQDVDRANKRQEVERSNKRQATERVQSEKHPERTRQFADAGPNRRSLDDATERRIEKRRAERVDQKRVAEQRKAPRVEERSRQTRSDRVEERGKQARSDRVQERTRKSRSDRVEERSKQTRSEKVSGDGDREQRSGSQKASTQKASKGSRGGGKQRA